MNTDFFGLAVLLISLVFVIPLQVAALLGSMWVVNQLGGEKIHDRTYAEFDFENFNRHKLIELLIKLTVMIAPVSLLLHLFIFLFCYFTIRIHATPWGIILMLLEGGAVAAGLIYWLKVDRYRALILAGAVALFYIIVYGFFLHGKLS